MNKSLSDTCRYLFDLRDELLFKSPFRHASELSSRLLNVLIVVRNHHSASQMIDWPRIAHQGSHHRILLHSSPNTQKRLNHLCFGEVQGIDSPQREQLLLKIGNGFLTAWRVTYQQGEILKKVARSRRRTLRDLNYICCDYPISCLLRIGPIALLFSCYENGGTYSCEPSNSLHPRRSILAFPRPSSPPPHQHTNQRRDQDRAHQMAYPKFERNTLRKHGHPLAIKHGRSMKGLSWPVQGVPA